MKLLGKAIEAARNTATAVIGTILALAILRQVSGGFVLPVEAADIE